MSNNDDHGFGWQRPKGKFGCLMSDDGGWMIRRIKGRRPAEVGFFEKRSEKAGPRWRIVDRGAGCLARCGVGAGLALLAGLPLA